MKEIEKTLNHEGGYVSDPNDAGGETKYGISKRAYPKLNIKRLTRAQAAEIFKQDYFDAVGAEKFSYAPFRWKLFDIAVNMGVSKAMEFLSQVNHPDTASGVLELMDQQIKRYAAIVAADPAKVKFIKGWVARGLDRGDDLIEHKQHV
ncbi:MAG: hypothetical protein L0Y80_01015 [Ignavibacteriae bacterium]|nr:hypothetical protein [Ignavibacteriota bacterium]